MVASESWSFVAAAKCTNVPIPMAVVSLTDAVDFICGTG